MWTVDRDCGCGCGRGLRMLSRGGEGVSEGLGRFATVLLDVGREQIASPPSGIGGGVF